MKEVILTGNLEIGTNPDGSGVIRIQTGPGEVYVVPLPDTPGPQGQPSPKQAVVSGLTGITIASHVPPAGGNHSGGPTG